MNILRALVTGSNRGIGLGLVSQLLDRGDLVFASCRNPEQATDLNRLQEQWGEQLTVLPLDVSQPPQLDSAVAVIKGFADGLDVLFNNAGVGGGKSSLGHVTEDDLMTTFRINAVAPLMVVQAFLPLLMQGERPVIVNITSRMGSIADNGSGGSYAYRASKAALNMLNKSLAVDLTGKGIIAVVVHPGWVKTGMGGPGAPLSIRESASGILHILDALEQTDSGRFFAWNGKEIPW